MNSWFFSGESNFLIDIQKPSVKIGYSVALRVSITQHIRDERLINNIKNVLNCGFISKNSNKNIIILKISNFEDISNKIIPLFDKYEIKGVKRLDYLDFCLTAELIAKKFHLSFKGME